MSKSTIRGVEAEPLAENDVAEYLQQHPDFFERHAAVLARLKLPHNRGAAAVSLVERQVTVLRDKHSTLEQRLHDLIEVGRANDALTQKIHSLACQLISAKTPAALVDALERSLREDFGATQWLLVTARADFAPVTDSSSHVRVVQVGAPELRMFDTLFESGRPRCGQIRDAQRDYLFGTGTDEIGSAALVPLGATIGAGLLAIGSPDTERFHPAMSTDYLARIGELVAAALAAV
ncbi:MAG: DUF484 family protein [Steroidobacteraceae bacterium]